MNDFRDLQFYQKAFRNAMRVFEMTRTFPPEEKYALISQIRNSSRSVCSNIAEGYRKRHYEKHFIAKISDADMENSESIVWLEFALACGYISRDICDDLCTRFEEVGRMLNYALQHPDRFSR